MSAFYSAMRDSYIKRVKLRYCVYCLFTYLASYTCFRLIFSSLTGVVNSEGKTFDLYAVGCACFMSFVFLVHTLFYQNIRDWNRAVRIFVIILACLFITVFILMGVFKFSPAFNRHMFEVLSTPLYWLAIPPTVFVMALPYTFERLYRQLILHPQFYQQ